MTCSDQTVVKIVVQLQASSRLPTGKGPTSWLLGATGRIPHAAMLLVWRGSMVDLSACVQAIGVRIEVPQPCREERTPTAAYLVECKVLRWHLTGVPGQARACICND